MKRLFFLLFVLVTPACIMAQEQSAQSTLIEKNQHNSHEETMQSTLLKGQCVTNTDNGKTITLHLGEQLFVELPDNRQFIYGNEQRGLEAVSTVSFDGVSDESILNENPFLSLSSSYQKGRNFTAAAVGQTTLSYKRMTRYVGYGGCPVPMCIAIETISFNIVVIQ